jgi:hypothetical protein
MSKQNNAINGNLKDGLHILNVTYGNNNKYINITNNVKKNFVKNDKLFISKNINLNEIFSDPCPSTLKEIKINAVNNIPIDICVKEFNGYLENAIEIYENNLHILNAEYGANNNYINITNKVKQFFLKNKNLIIPKKINLNKIFGDNCMGIQKEIKIHAVNNNPIYICEKECGGLLENDIFLCKNGLNKNTSDLSDLSDYLFEDIQKVLVNSQKKNICFINFVNIINDINILADKINYIKNTKLYDNLDYIFIIMTGENCKIPFLDGKIQMIYYSENKFTHEYSVLSIIKKLADKINVDFKILYINLNYILQNPNHYESIKYLEYFLIENSDLCLNALNKYSCVGVNQQYYFNDCDKYKNNFSGNFWWSQSSHIKTLPDITESQDIYAYENWLIGNLEKNDYRKFISLHHTNYDLYKNVIAPHVYRLDIIQNAVCHNLKIDFVKTKSIYGVYFICCIGNYLSIINNQIQKLIESGLYNECDKIICFVSMANNECLEILQKYNKIQVISTNENLNENFAINNYKKYIDFNNYNLFYIHSKSVVGKNQYFNDSVELCNYFTINKWRLNIELLNYYDCVGTNLKNYPKKHYSGNFWWAKSEHLNKLKNINDQHLSSEMYVLSYVKTNYVSLYQSCVQNEIENNYFDNIEGKNVVFITSNIIVSDTPFSYINKRSIYSRQDRIMQTINTINSVRKNIPDSYIILLDNSLLNNFEINILSKLVNSFINITDNSLVNYYTDKFQYKAFGEISQMIQFFELFLQTNYTQIKNFFKITGRYEISQNFDYNQYDNNLNIFKKNLSVTNREYYYTCFYKLDKSILEEVKNVLVNLIENKEKYMNDYSDLEVIFPNAIIDKIHLVNNLGIVENIGVWKSINVI